VSGEPRSQEFADDEIERIVARGETNLWLQADQITGADIHVGLMTSRMNVDMADGHRIKLLLASQRPGRAAAHDSAVIVGSRDGPLTRRQLDEA
jgi:hypothetical protein